MKVQNFKDISINETHILRVWPFKTFLGKSEFCGLTEISRAFDKTEIEGNNILLEIGEGNRKKVICKMVEI